MNTRFAKVWDFLGLRRSIVGLLLMVVLVGMGERMAERFLPLYLLALGAGISLPGYLHALDNFLSSVYSYPGGYLADKWGTKKALLVFNLTAMAGYLVVIAVPRWEAVFVGAVLFLSWSSLSMPAMLSMVAGVLPPTKRTMGVTLHSLVNRLPRAIGPLIGGVLISVYGLTNGVRYSFAVAFVLAGASAIIQQVMFESDRPAVKLTKPPLPKNPLLVFKRMDSSLRILFAADVLVRFAGHIPFAYVVIYVTQTIREPVTELQFGVLTMIEMVTAMLVYIPVAYLADRGNKKPFIILAFSFFTLFPLILPLCQSFWVLVPAFILRGLKEFGEPTRKALILDLADEDARATTFGAYYFVRDFLVTFAAIGGAYLWGLHPLVNFLTAAACGAAGTLWFAWKGTSIKSREAMA